MIDTLKPAAAYFAIVFVAGFALGALRGIAIVPMVGELLAVAIELPVMIIVSWLACSFVLRRWPVAAVFAPRATMGAVAFLLLLAGEALISLTFGGLTLAQHVGLYSTAPVLLGLAGQIAYGLFPLMQKGQLR